MGGPKALTRLGEGTFLTAVLDAGRRAGLPAPVVVVAPEAERIRREHAGAACRFLLNPDPAAGPISSIRAVLADPEGAVTDAVLVHPVDHPLVAPVTLRAITARFRAGDADIVVPTHDGRGGHPTLFGRAVFAELLAVPEGEGARLVVRRDPSRVARLAVDDPGVRRNLDTPEDVRGADPSA
jgi:molybdenum cofactor cytidylyltransferase